MCIRSCDVERCESIGRWVRTSPADADLHTHLCTLHWQILRKHDWTAAAGYSPVREEKHARRSTSALTGKRIVICEEDGITSKLLSHGLSQHGLAVVGCARDGLEAVEFVLRVRPDIVLVDIDLTGLDGFSATERILAQGSRVCVVMLSAFSDVDSIQRGRQAGCMGWMVKPVTTSELITRLELAWTAFEEQNLALVTKLTDREGIE